MTSRELMAALRSSGFTVWSENGGLFVSPRPKLSEEQKADITAHKVALLDLLAEEATDAAIEADLPRVLRVIERTYW